MKNTRQLLLGQWFISWCIASSIAYSNAEQGWKVPYVIVGTIIAYAILKAISISIPRLRTWAEKEAAK